jgi:hypothetical protein
MLGPKRTPWSFPEMLAHGLLVSILYVSLAGLVGQLLIRLKRGKSDRPSGAHPLADAEID